MSMLVLAGICLMMLGLGGRFAVGRRDSYHLEEAIRRGDPKPKPSTGRKRIANTGTGIGIAAIILGLLFGGRAGFGPGAGFGLGNGGNQTESTAVADETTYEEALKTAEDGQTIKISVKGVNISFNGYVCSDDAEFEKIMEESYKDGMTITLVEDYADSETFSRVREYLDDKAYTYQETKS